MPFELSDREDHSVIAYIHYDDANLGYERETAGFEVEALFRAEIIVPHDLQKCRDDRDCHFVMDLVIENTSPKLITGIVCEVELPFGVQTLDGKKQLTMVQEELHPYETITKTAELKVVEFNEAANFYVTISSENGGHTGSSRTVGIAPLPSYY